MPRSRCAAAPDRARSRRWLRAALLPLLLLSTAALAAPRPALPALQLPARLQGEAAIAALGARLEAVAAHHRLAPERLRAILRRDRTAWLDRNGRLFYIDVVPALPAVSVNAPAPTAALDLGQTFRLHSRPGAARTLYLDFNGHLVRESAWRDGPVLARPFDTDGNPLAFSEAEQASVQAIWQRVAEDYAPFDINVTTEAPPEHFLRRDSDSDPYFGTRVVITRNTFYDCVCGGIAYVGVFDFLNPGAPDYYQPAWVFHEALGNDEKFIAEAVSHEAGHTLGLSHDGTSTLEYYPGHGEGETGWAPLMGVAYFAHLTQWSRGEYPDASNSEDDLAIIQRHGVPLRADDAGDSAATATALAGRQSGSTVTVTQAGLIGRETDIDVFRFEAGTGPLALAIAPAARGPNLDIGAALFDAGGQLLARANPAEEIEARLALTLPAGRYFLAVTGVGKSAGIGYPDYGSLGHYRISGSHAAAAVQPTVHIGHLTLRLNTLLGRYFRCEATVGIVTASQAPAAGASVSGAWSGVTQADASATSDAAGSATFRSPWTRSRGSCTFTVNGITLPGHGYSPAGNSASHDSLHY